MCKAGTLLTPEHILPAVLHRSTFPAINQAKKPQTYPHPSIAEAKVANIPGSSLKEEKN